MKANEAPEKIYLQEPTKVRTEKSFDNDVEYTHTDAFIEKACEWLKEIFYEYESLTDYNPMNDFKNYMKGE